MKGLTYITLKGEKMGVLFGTPIYKFIRDYRTDEGSEIKPSKNEFTNLVYITWAAMMNYCDFKNKPVHFTMEEVYEWANANMEEFKDVVKCWSDSQMIGVDVKELAKANQKKKLMEKDKKKKNWFGRILQKLKITL